MRYLEIEEEQYQVGTTKGWGDFIRWADSLDLDANYALIQFAEHGHTEAPTDVLDELKAALDNDPPPDAATRDVATNLLSVLRAHDGADFFAVSDGTEHGEESETAALAFDPSESRDDSGKWTAGGGGGGAKKDEQSPAPADKPAQEGGGEKRADDGKWTAGGGGGSAKKEATLPSDSVQDSLSGISESIERELEIVGEDVGMDDDDNKEQWDSAIESASKAMTDYGLGVHRAKTGSWYISHGDITVSVRDHSNLSATADFAPDHVVYVKSGRPSTAGEYRSLSDGLTKAMSYFEKSNATAALAFDPSEARDEGGKWTTGGGGGGANKSESNEPSKKESGGSKKYPVADKGEWYSDADYEARGGKVKTMSPDEYLKSVRPLQMDDESRENIDDLKRHIQSGKTLDPLKIYADGKEDGRHRAMAAKELGMKSVPVIDFRKDAASPAPADKPAQEGGGEKPATREEWGIVVDEIDKAHAMRLWDEMNKRWDSGESIRFNTMTRATRADAKHRDLFRHVGREIQMRQGRGWVSLKGQAMDTMAMNMGINPRLDYPDRPDEPQTGNDDGWETQSEYVGDDPDFKEDREKYHREMVEDAIKRGHDVPARVLADYPELAIKRK